MTNDGEGDGGDGSNSVPLECGGSKEVEKSVCAPWVGEWVGEGYGGKPGGDPVCPGGRGRKITCTVVTGKQEGRETGKGVGVM